MRFSKIQSAAQHQTAACPVVLHLASNAGATSGGHNCAMPAVWTMSSPACLLHCNMASWLLDVQAVMVRPRGCALLSVNLQDLTKHTLFV